MATHKVPQDVEAEDKLLGPLSLRQLIFTILGLGFGYLVYFFFVNVHPIASIIFIPFCLFFLILGLYQRKDQPTEIFLASAVRYYFKPRKRVWNQEGYHERVIVTAPPVIEKRYTKDFTGAEAVSRLDNLSRLLDSRGWTSKVQQAEWQNPNFAVAAASDRLVQPISTPSPFNTFTQPVDIQDQNSSIVAQSIGRQIEQNSTMERQRAIKVVQQARESVTQEAQVAAPELTQPTPIEESQPTEPIPSIPSLPVTPVEPTPNTQAIEIAPPAESTPPPVSTVEQSSHSDGVEITIQH